jgi:hypothetical protein
MVQQLFKPIVDDHIRFWQEANEAIRDTQFCRNIARVVRTTATPAI